MQKTFDEKDPVDAVFLYRRTTHQYSDDTLINLDGTYAQLYKIQAKCYHGCLVIFSGFLVTDQHSLATPQRPCLPIPPPLMMTEPGSFAHRTLTQRWPAIARRIITENDFSSDIVASLETLIQDLFTGVIRPLEVDQGPDLDAWEIYLAPWIGKSWQMVPWYVAEVYFYRRLLEATQYFQPSPWQGIDPFARQKQASLSGAMVTLRTNPAQIHSQGTEELDSENLFRFYQSLWGNQADLSLNPAESAASHSQAADHILVDDLPVLMDYLQQVRPARIDLIADNAGLELVSDLALGDFLLASQAAREIYLHLKPHPTFVSDATVVDVHNTLTSLVAASSSELRELAQRLKEFMAAGRLHLRQDLFWTAPLPFWEMPQPLRQQLAQANLVLIKGDANYRRLLGDRHWSFTTPFAEIAGYFSAPLLALRTLKSEVVAGLQPNQIEELNHSDPEWLINGQWAVIQSVNLSR